MVKYTTDLTVEETDYIRETLAGNPGTLEIWGEPVSNFRTVALDGPAIRHLETLSSDCDGHVDSDGNLWISGTANPLTVVHNAR